MPERGTASKSCTGCFLTLRRSQSPKLRSRLRDREGTAGPRPRPWQVPRRMQAEPIRRNHFRLCSNSVTNSTSKSHSTIFERKKCHTVKNRCDLLAACRLRFDGKLQDFFTVKSLLLVSIFDNMLRPLSQYQLWQNNISVKAKVISWPNQKK